MTAKFGLLIGFVGLWCLWNAPQVQAADHLDCASTLKQVCAHASAQPAGEKAASFPREYLKGRLDRLMTIYSVDVSARSFGVAGYDAVTQQLKLTPQTRYVLFGGDDALELVDAPLIVFELPPEEAERIEMDRATDLITLRLFFMVSSLSAPETDYCAESDSSGMTIRGRLLGARLGRPQKAGEEAPSTMVASFDADSGWDVAKVLGLSMESGPRVWPRVTVQIKKFDGTLTETARAQMIGDLQLALMPCYLAALSKGGSQAASLTIRSDFVAQRIDNPKIQIDTGSSPVLSTCAVSALKGLSWPIEDARSMTFNAWFQKE